MATDRNKNNTFYSKNFHTRLRKQDKSGKEILPALTGASAAVNTVAPVLSGTGTVGQTLSLTTGSWTAAVAYERQYRRNGTVIDGATASTYVLVAADDGTTVTGHVRAQDASGIWSGYTASNSKAIAYAAPSAAGGLVGSVYEIGVAISSFNVAANFTGSGITYAVTSGVLPTGLVLSSAGLITGTPTAETDNLPITVTGTNSGGSAFTIFSMGSTVYPVITSVVLDNLVDPAALSFTVSENALMYWMVDANATRTAAQVVAGGGDAAGSFLVTTGLIENTIDLSGVPGGTRDLHMVAQDTTGAFSTVNNYQTIISDATAPVITGSTPADNATGVVVGNSITITFDDDMQFGTGNIVLREDNAGFADLESFSVTTEVGTGNGQVSITGNVLTINPTAAMSYSKNYAVRIDATALDNVSAVSFAGIANDTTLNWATEAAPIPVVVSSNPADNATNVDITNSMTVTFDMAVVFGTGNITLRVNIASVWSDLELFDVATEVGSGNGQVQISGAVLTINPTLSLVNNREYAIRIAATAIDGTGGGSFAGIANDTTISFTTESAANPVISSSNPADNATGVSVTTSPTITFDLPIQFGTGNITLRQNNSGWSDLETFDVTTEVGTGDGQVSISGSVLTINPTASLTASREYAIRIASTAIDGTGGGDFAGIANDTTLSFTAAAGASLPVLAQSIIAQNDSTDPQTGATTTAIVIGSAANRLLVMKMSLSKSTSATTNPTITATFNGVSMTVQINQDRSVANRPCVVICTLIAPSTGSFGVVWTSSINLAASGITLEEWTNVDQTTPVVSAVGAEGGATTVITIPFTVTNNNSIISGVANIAGNLAVGDIVVDSPGIATQEIDTGANSTQDSVSNHAYKEIASSGATSIDWTCTSSVYVAAAIEIKAA